MVVNRSVSIHWKLPGTGSLFYEKKRRKRYIFLVYSSVRRLHIPVTLIAPYPSVTTTSSVNRLLGTPLLMKCLTSRYLLPVGSSFIMAAVHPPSQYI